MTDPTSLFPQADQPPDPGDPTEALKQEARRLGFDPVGVASADGSGRLSLRSAALERWLEAGHAGSMGWMHDTRRRRVEALLPGVRSLLMVGLPYHVNARGGIHGLKVARYGWGRDYHRVLDQRLRQLGRWLEERAPQTRWRACVDAAPLLEKAWAEEAGLGWIGKNGNLINRRRGSWLLLGALLTTRELKPDPAAPSLCGRCSQCIEACPTSAISEPFVVDARRCIAFHTIENREAALPTAIAERLQGWVAGCDICQEVCPWNGQELQNSEDPAVQPRPWLLELEADAALSWSDQDWDVRLRASALRRIRPWMWRRNIRAALGADASSH